MISRTRNIILLILSLAYFLWRGTAKKYEPRNNLRILVWQNAKLGDMICTTPVLKAIKRARPGVTVIVVGSATNAQILYGSIDVDHYIDKKKGFWSNARSVRESKSQVALLATPDFDSLATLYLAGVPMIVAPRVVGGWSPLETTSYKILRCLVMAVPHRMRHYAPGEYLELLKPIGIFSTDTTKHLTFEPSGTLDEFKGRLLVGISPGAGNKIKNWSADRFAGVADYLVEKFGATIVMLGGPGDRQETTAMLGKMVHSSKCVDLSQNISIESLKEAISKLKLFIAVDTGPIYIAEAFNIPTIDITGPIDENEQPPIGELHMVVTPTERKNPELFVLNARSYNFDEARRQADSITVEQVCGFVDQMMIKLGYDKR